MRLLRILIVLFFVPLIAKSQIDDVGLWLGASAEKKVTKDLSFLLGEQIRLRNDVNEIGSMLTDAGVEYDLNKKFGVGVHYRFILANQDNYYSNRHRFYLNLSYKEKAGSFIFTLRER